MMPGAIDYDRALRVSGGIVPKTSEQHSADWPCNIIQIPIP